MEPDKISQGKMRVADKIQRSLHLTGHVPGRRVYRNKRKTVIREILVKQNYDYTEAQGKKSISRRKEKHWKMLKKDKEITDKNLTLCHLKLIFLHIYYPMPSN